MGFDTYLEIGDQTAAMWRKQSSPLPRMLFRHNQLVVSWASDGGDDDEFTYPVDVRFETTAEEALLTLEDSGLDGARASLRTAKLGSPPSLVGS